MTSDMMMSYLYVPIKPKNALDTAKAAAAVEKAQDFCFQKSQKNLDISIESSKTMERKDNGHHFPW